MSIPTTAVERYQPVLSDVERMTMLGFLAAYGGFTRDAYALDLRQFTAWCWQHDHQLFDVRRVDIECFARGIPMPAVYVRVLAYAWGDPTATRTCLLGETFTPTEAHTLGMFHELNPPDELIERAITVADMTPPDCLDQYAFTKRACLAAALRDIAELADPLDDELPDGMTSDDARHAHRRYLQHLKGTPAPW
jgi:enoyl-CoA hydratase